MKTLIIDRKNRIFFTFWILLFIIMPHCYAVTGTYDNVPDLLKSRANANRNSKIKYKPFNLDKSDIPALIKELKNNDPGICAEAARLLSGSTLKNKRGGMENDIIAALRNNLKSDNHLVRQSAAVSIVNIDSPLSVDDEFLINSSLSKEMMPFLIEALEDETVGYASDALFIFRRMGHNAKEAVPAIIESMKRNPKSRISYYMTLVSIGTPEALEVSKGYIKKREALKQYYDIRGELSTKPLPNIIVALVFVCLFWLSRRLRKAGKQITYLPLLIPMVAWSFIAICAILYNNLVSWIYTIFHTLPAIDAPPSLFMMLYIKYHTLIPGFLTLATLAGIIPWLLSLWRLKKRISE